MTEEQRSRLRSRVEQNRKGNCYIHDRDADAIDAALAEIDRKKAVAVEAEWVVKAFDACEPGSVPLSLSFHIQSLRKALEGRD